MAGILSPSRSRLATATSDLWSSEQVTERLPPEQLVSASVFGPVDPVNASNDLQASFLRPLTIFRHA